MRLAFVGAAKAFNPSTDVAGNKLWLNIESLAGTGSGASISAWNDSSTNGVNFTGASSLPTYSTTAGPTGGPAVAFASQFLKSAAQTQTQPYTTFGVVKSTATTSMTWFGSGSSAQIAIGYAGGNNWDMYNGTVLQAGASTANTNWNIWVAISNGASSKLYINGGAATLSGNAGTNAFSSATMQIGGQNGATSLWAGNMTDLLVYSGALSLTDINTIGSYLGTLRSITWTTAT